MPGKPKQINYDDLTLKPEATTGEKLTALE